MGRQRGLLRHFVQLVRRHHLRHPFGNAAEKRGIVELLECIATQHRPFNLPGEQNQRRGILLVATAAVAATTAAVAEVARLDAGQSQLSLEIKQNVIVGTVDGARGTASIRATRNHSSPPDSAERARGPGSAEQKPWLPPSRMYDISIVSSIGAR